MGEEKEEEKKDERWKPILLIILVIIVLVLSYVFGLGEGLGGLQDWLDSLGFWGPVVFALLYIGAVVFAFPASILTILAGVLFGPVLGVVLVSFASTMGAALAFLFARYFAREATERWLRNNKSFKRLEMMTEFHGPMIVALVRLLPIFPFNLTNYGFGLTRIPFKTYIFWSWVCMLPFTIVFVLGGEIVMSLSEGKIPWPLFIVIILMVVILHMVVKQARQLMKTKEQECLENLGANCLEDVMRE